MAESFLSLGTPERADILRTAAARSQSPPVGFVVGTDGDGQSGVVLRVEQEYEAIGSAEAHGVEIVAHIKLFVSSSGGEFASEQLVDHRRQLMLHRLRESTHALPEGLARLVELPNRRGLPIRQAPPPRKLRT